MEKIYVLSHTSCVYESAWVPVAYCSTREKAEKAMAMLVSGKLEKAKDDLAFAEKHMRGRDHTLIYREAIKYLSAPKIRDDPDSYARGKYEIHGEGWGIEERPASELPMLDSYMGERL